MALNFLVTGVKMLKKSLDKKKMKEGAKKFVGGDTVSYTHLTLPTKA